MSVRFAVRHQRTPRYSARTPSLPRLRQAAELAGDADDWRAVQAAADQQLPAYVADLRAALVPALDDDVITRALIARSPAAGLALLKPSIDGVIASMRAVVRAHAAPVIARSMRVAMTSVAGIQAAQAHAEPSLELSFERINLEALQVAEDGLTHWLADLPDDQYQAAQTLLTQAIGGELDVRQFARQLAGTIGLDERSRGALARYDNANVQAGLSVAEIDKRYAAYSDRLKRQRAETIARTETMYAANLGQLYLWESAVRDGLIDPSTTKTMWIVTPDDRLCALCRQMTGERGTVPLGHAFDTPRGGMTAPPMHPRCRCTVGLVFDESAIGRPPAQPGIPTAPTYNVAESLGRVAPTHAKRVEAALALIGKIHSIPKPKYQIPVLAEQSKDWLGVFRSKYINQGTSIAPASIAMTNLKNGAYSATFIHEIGHYLHQQVFLENPNGFYQAGLSGAQEKAFLTGALPADFQPIMSAIYASPEYAKLKQTYAGYKSGVIQVANQAQMTEFYDYLLNPKELIARSYAQYVGSATNDAGVLRDIAKGESNGRQWTPANFGAIHDAYDTYFKLKGLAPS